MIIEGVDVSHHQDPDKCDWATAYDAGLRFAWVKSTEGRDHINEAAERHIESILLEAPALMRGLYHFGRPDNRFRESSDGWRNGLLEASWAASQSFKLGGVHGCLPLMLDLEKYTDQGTVTTEQRADYVRGFLAEYEACTGVLPCVYAGPTYWGYQHSPEFAAELHGRGVLLVLAKYGTGPDPSDEIGGWPWGVWQWSGGGDFAYADPWPGLPHPIDRLRYRGSFGELEGRLNR